MTLRNRFLLVAAALASAACTTTKDVRSGRAWEDARPSDYRATKDEVVAEVTKFMTARGYRMEWSGSQDFVKGFKPGETIADQNVELHVKIEPGAADGTTRVTAISGRSLGVEWKGREVHERLHDQLRAAFGDR